MDSVAINEAIAVSGFSQEIIDWIWTDDYGDNKPAMVVKKGM